MIAYTLTGNSLLQVIFKNIISDHANNKRRIRFEESTFRPLNKMREVIDENSLELILF